MQRHMMKVIVFVCLDDVFIFSPHWLYFVSFFLFILQYSSLRFLSYLPIPTQPSISNLSLSIPVFPFQSLSSPFLLFFSIYYFYSYYFLVGLLQSFGSGSVGSARFWIPIRVSGSKGQNINQELQKLQKKIVLSVKRKREKNS